MSHGGRIAVADLGTNSTRLLVADPRASAESRRSIAAPASRDSVRASTPAGRLAARRSRARPGVPGRLPRPRGGARRRAPHRRGHERRARRRQRRAAPRGGARAPRVRHPHDQRRGGGAPDLPRRDGGARPLGRPGARDRHRRREHGVRRGGTGREPRLPRVDSHGLRPLHRTPPARRPPFPRRPCAARGLGPRDGAGTGAGRAC